MKSVRFLLPLLLLLCTFSLCGCTGKEEKKIEDAVKQELDQLKNLDSITTQKYISYQELFPGEPEDIAISSDIEEVFSLFFQDFDYKILDVNVDKDRQSAQANLRLVTLDAHALAEDFSKAQLKHEISQSASSEEATEQTISLEERYMLLDELLKSNDYQTVERNCTISLDASDKDGETSWEIRRTNTLENDLVGGLMNNLTDPDILSPEDTILVYLNTLKNMSTEELGNYLNADSIISTEDPAKISLAEALVKQTGCDAVMVGRAVRGNPWLFRELNHYFRTGELLERPSVEEIREMILRHARKQIELKGEFVGIREMRKHVAWYTAGMRHSAGLRRESNTIERYEALEALLSRL